MTLIDLESYQRFTDEYSDHDFFVIAETAHGVKVLYDGGHLLEFAVFAPDELALARMNRHRVLLDRERVTSRVAEVVAATPTQVAAEARADRYLLGQLLTNVCLGTCRPSGQTCSTTDPHRRFERAYPALGKELDDALTLEVPAAGARLLVIARRELQDRTDFPVKSWDVIHGWTGADPSRS